MGINFVESQQLCSADTVLPSMSVSLKLWSGCLSLSPQHGTSPCSSSATGRTPIHAAATYSIYFLALFIHRWCRLSLIKSSDLRKELVFMLAPCFFFFAAAAVTAVTPLWCLWSQTCQSVPVWRIVGRMVNVGC